MLIGVVPRGFNRDLVLSLVQLKKGKVSLVVGIGFFQDASVLPQSHFNRLILGF